MKVIELIHMLTKPEVNPDADIRFFNRDLHTVSNIDTVNVVKRLEKNIVNLIG